MIVRLQIDRPAATPRRPSSRRLLEFSFLLLGLFTVDVYIWNSVEAEFQQAFDNYSLDQQLQHRTPSLLGFLSSEVGMEDRATAENSDTPPQPAPQRAAQPKAQDLIGRIEIPRLQITASVREGVDYSTLRVAVAHMPSSALPGMPGNVALAAHRDTLFRNLKGIHKNDRITVETTQGSYDYVVESLAIVKPTDVSVLRFRQGDQLLTLITCYPFNYVGSAPNRFIVKARQRNLTARSSPRA